ncbi:MAG: rhodanese-like domain-containing protein [Bacteroidia bacterium]|nr:rhodanese-like domain-containing protein [Bacteroidia bacterium]
MRKSLIITTILLTFCTATLSQSTDSVKYQSLDPYDFQMQFLREDSALLIDVREFFEYRKSRIKGALFLPSSEGFDIAADTLDKRLSLFCYCYSGGRSTKALLFFYDKGFRKLYNLDGGITAWKKDGFRVDKKKIRRNK